MEKRFQAIQTALVITTGLLVLHYWTDNTWLLRAALAVSVIGVLWPRAAALLHTGWTYLAQALGWLNGRILLSILFFIILTPIAWLARRFGASSVQLQRKPAGASYYIVRDHTYKKEDLEQMW